MEQIIRGKSFKFGDNINTDIISPPQYNKKAKEESKGSTFQLMMRSHDPEIVWDLLRRQV